jgi:hypothetical protein
VIDEDGKKVYRGLGEYCIEVEDTSEIYKHLPSIHTSRLKGKSTLISNDWFKDET